jgi:hypothetical protein
MPFCTSNSLHETSGPPRKQEPPQKKPEFFRPVGCCKTTPLELKGVSTKKNSYLALTERSVSDPITVIQVSLIAMPEVVAQLAQPAVE